VSYVKPTQVSNGGTSKGIGNLNSAIEKADRLLELKLTSSQFHQIASLTLLANLCLLLPEEIGLFQRKASGDTLKIQKPPATLIYAYIYPYISKIS
jgi:hypothetical protein